MVEIKGLEKFAPKDFPGFISSTVFLGGCNFRCPFCHNADLVLRPETLPTIPMDYFLSYIDSRKNWLDGICITGGEPLIHDGLEDFLRLIKERHFLVKVDTNGSFPLRLKDLIRKKLVDYIAMDVKAPLEKYREITKSSVNKEDIQKSIDIIKSSGLDFIFRTTVVPGMITKGDIERISKMLTCPGIYQIQQFQPRNTIDNEFQHRKPYGEKDIKEFARIAEPFFSEVKIEGI